MGKKIERTQILKKEKRKHIVTQHENVVALKRNVTKDRIHGELESLADKEKNPLLDRSVQLVHIPCHLGRFRGPAIPSLFC